MKPFNEVIVALMPKTSPAPFGILYVAKGAYSQGKHMIVVGRIDKEKGDSTIRIKYKKEDIIDLTFV